MLINGGDELGFLPKFIKKAVDPREHLKMVKGAGKAVGKGVASGARTVGNVVVKAHTIPTKLAAGALMSVFSRGGGGEEAAAEGNTCGFFQRIQKFFGGNPDCQ